MQELQFSLPPLSLKEKGSLLEDHEIYLLFYLFIGAYSPVNRVGLFTTLNIAEVESCYSFYQGQ